MSEAVNAHEMVSELLVRNPQVARVLFSHRMHCVGCAIAAFETVAEVCVVYGVPLEQLLEELRHGSGIDASGEL